MEVRDYANAENEVFIIDNGEIIWFYRSDSMYFPLSCSAHEASEKTLNWPVPNHCVAPYHLSVCAVNVRIRRALYACPRAALDLIEAAV